MNLSSFFSTRIQSAESYVMPHRSTLRAHLRYWQRSYDIEHPQRLKAAQLILERERERERGHGAPREEPASVDIISQFVDGLEAEGLCVPETMREYFRNEIERATYIHSVK